MADTTDDEWDRALAVNMTGIVAVCRAAIPALRDGGSIVNMASMNSLVANCVLFLAGGESTFVAGSAFGVDGGSTAR